MKVALVERATFPRDTLSTHIFETDALAFLNRLGVADQPRAAGAPFIYKSDVRTEGFRSLVFVAGANPVAHVCGRRAVPGACRPNVEVAGMRVGDKTLQARVGELFVQPSLRIPIPVGRIRDEELALFQRRPGLNAGLGISAPPPPPRGSRRCQQSWTARGPQHSLSHRIQGVKSASPPR